MQNLLFVVFGIIILCLIFLTLFVTLWDEKNINLTIGNTGPTGECLINSSAITYYTTYDNSEYISNAPNGYLLPININNSQVIGNTQGSGNINPRYIRLDETQSGQVLKFTSYYGSFNQNIVYIFCTACIEGDNCNRNGICTNNSRALLTDINGQPFYYNNVNATYINLLIDNKSNVFVYPEN